jgi:hypothetical protein
MNINLVGNFRNQKYILCFVVLFCNKLLLNEHILNDKTDSLVFLELVKSKVPLLDNCERALSEVSFRLSFSFMFSSVKGINDILNV